MNRSRGGPGGRRKFKKTITRPIVLLYRLMNSGKVEIWLKDDNDTRLQGTIVGLDAHMNITVKDTVEINKKRGTEKKIGLIILKSDNICTVHSLDEMIVA